jgi:hypothetical protein
MAKKHFKDLLDLMERASPHRNSNLALNDLAEQLSIQGCKQKKEVHGLH